MKKKTVKTEKIDSTGNTPTYNTGNNNSTNKNNTGSGPTNTNPTPKGPNIFNALMIFFLITVIFNLFFMQNTSKQQSVTYSQFLNLVTSDNVSSAVIEDKNIKFTISKDANMKEVTKDINYKDDSGMEKPKAGQTYSTVKMEDDALVSTLTKHNVNFTRTTSNNSSPVMSIMMMWILPMVIMYILYFFVARKAMKKMGGSSSGGMFGIGKSKAKEYNMEKKTGVTFKDVAGQDEAKESLMEMVDFLHNPKKYEEIGAKQPKGALLVGPPGTGKTLLAKAVAGEANVPFYSISGSEFVEMFVGVGASRVRDLFEQAKKNAPCIIFIDEIDAIGKSRDNQMGSNDEREQTLNQLLAEMDGFESDKGIVVLAATNRPEVLDKALLRPGRFDRRIIVEKPDLPGREAILKVHIKNIKVDDDINLHDIALATSGATGADLANMVNEASLLAVKDDRNKVIQKDLMDAVEIIIAGKEKKDRIMNPEERNMVAYHEVGHALVTALQKNSQPVQKISIVPRTLGSLGYTMNVPEEERYLMTKDDLLSQIKTLLGGRAAEIVKFDTTTTGASNDIERATKLARSMVTQYGMSEKFGPVELESTQNKYLDGKNISNCSPETQTMIDDEVRNIISECQDEAVKLIEENGDKLDKISEYLLEKENITGEQFMNLLNNDITKQ